MLGFSTYLEEASSVTLPAAVEVDSKIGTASHFLPNGEAAPLNARPYDIRYLNIDIPEPWRGGRFDAMCK